VSVTTEGSTASVDQSFSDAEMVRQRRAPAPTGEVLDRGGAFAVCLGRSFAVAVDEVWRWLSEPARMHAWLGELVPDQQAIRLTGAGTAARHLDYHVEALDPCRRVTLSLRNDGILSVGTSWRIDLVLTGTSGGCHLMLEQTISDRVAAPSVATACEFYLDRLVQVCHGRPLTDLEHEDYVESQGPAYRRLFPLPRSEG
jgi:uncharacterized protein YndB with AHSA1/START domain